MREIPWEAWKKKGRELFQKYKYVLLILLAGVVMLLWPAGKKAPPTEASSPAAASAPQEDFSVSALEDQMAATLSKIRGAGEVTVMLTVQGGSRQVLAMDEKSTRRADGGSETQSTTVVVSGGASAAGNGPVLIQQLYPKFQGALVVCSGGEDAGVRLKLMEAVSALTGLGTDKISICKGKG